MSAGDTLEQLREEVRERGYHYLSDGRVDRCINQGILRLCKRYPWEFLRATADGACPITVGRVRNVEKVYWTSQPTRLLRGANRNTLAVDLAEVGTPQLYYIENEVLKCWPDDGTELTVDYFELPAHMTLADDVCVIPAEHSQAAVDFAVREAAKDAHDWETVAGLGVECDNHVAEMIEALVSQHGDDDQVQITQREWA